MVTQKKRILGMLLTVTIILLIPLITMQFSNEVNWDPADFVVAGMLLLGTGLLLELIMWKVNNKGKRKVLYVVIIIFLLLLWAELAVGIFGTPIAGS